jgi:phage tail-like protein
VSALPKRYLFRTEAQWRDGIIAGGLLSGTGLGAAPRPAAAPVRIWEGDAGAPAATAAGELYWRDGAGALHWLSDADPPQLCSVPAGPFAAAARLAVTEARLWAAGPGLTMLDRRSLQPVADIDPGGTLRDIAAAHRRAIAALLANGGNPRLERIDERRRRTTISLPPLEPATFLVVRIGDRWVFGEPTRLRWAPTAPGGSWMDLPLSSLGHGDALRLRLLAALAPTGLALVCGNGPTARLVVLNVDGALIDDQPIGEALGEVHGIAGRSDSVWLATATGLWRWDLVPGGGVGESFFTTPALRSPLERDRGWLRAEIVAALPPGATISCRVGSTSDPGLAARAQAVISDPGLAPPAKTAGLDALLSWGPERTIAVGADAPNATTQGDAPSRWVLPLHDIGDEFLWLRLHVAEGTGAGGVAVSSLAVLYPQLTLMQRLPAIYRAAPTAHLRGLVALLDVFAQGLDRRIATLGRLVDPATAPDDWLDILAAWIGLPWDASLPAATRRAMLAAAPDLLAKRGTAAGLLKLLGVLLPDRPIRIEDAAALSPALLPHPGDGGPAMPMVLLGRPQDATRLNVAILGKTRLRPCGAADDPLAGLASWLRISLSATEDERKALAAPLAGLLAAYVPAGLRPLLRWHSWPPDGTGRTLDADFALQGPQPGLLGAAPRLGDIVLGGTGPSLRAGIELSGSERLL